MKSEKQNSAGRIRALSAFSPAPPPGEERAGERMPIFFKLVNPVQLGNGARALARFTFRREAAQEISVPLEYCELKRRERRAPLPNFAGRFVSAMILLMGFLVLTTTFGCAHQPTEKKNSNKISAAPDHPNVIVILTDDQAYGDLGSHGNQFLRTPNVDRLAGQSARFDHFYVTPVCATTRAALLTGRAAPKTGVWGVHLARDYMKRDETTLAEVFQRAGYTTAFMGKWHNGKHDGWLPWQRGFDDAWMASLYVHENNTVSHNGKAVQWKGWTSDRLADHAVEFIQAHKQQPYFLYLAELAPHEPWHAPDSLVKTYEARGLSKPLATVFAMIEQMDAGIGRVLDALDRSGQATNTIVVFLSDNGPIGNSSNLGSLTDAEMALRNPAGLRGVKGNLWENAVRVPCFIRWPGHTQTREISDVAHVTDLFPTLIELTDVKFSPSAGFNLDGRSLEPLLAAKENSLPPRELVLPYWEARWADYDSGALSQPFALDFDQQNIAVRDPLWKWVQALGSRELHDMTADPRETNNLIAAHPADAEHFSDVAHNWFSHLQREGRAYQQPRFPVGKVLHPIDEVAETRNVGQVPGYSATGVTGHVTVKTHWSEGWQAAGDSQTMHIEVRDAGRYRVETETENPTPGAVMAIETQGRRVEGKLTTDKISALGEITLQPGDAELTLKAVSLPDGRSALMKKLWGVRFTLLNNSPTEQ